MAAAYNSTQPAPRSTRLLFRRLPADEVVLHVALHVPHAPHLVSEEWLVLGSQRLTELRDRLFCVSDRNAEAMEGEENRRRAGGGQPPLRLRKPSAYFYIEGESEGSGWSQSPCWLLPCCCAGQRTAGVPRQHWLSPPSPRHPPLNRPLTTRSPPRPTGTFYNDLRDPAAVDYSAPIRRHQEAAGLSAPPHPPPGAAHPGVTTTGA